MAKRNPWRVNFTDRRARFVNLWNNVRRDFPPTIYVTLEFFSYISRKPQDLPGTSHTRRESWSFPFYTNNAWNAFFYHFVKISRFPWNLAQKRDLKCFFKDMRHVEGCLLPSLYRLTIRVFVSLEAPEEKLVLNKIGCLWLCAMIRMSDHKYSGLKFNRKLVFLLFSYWFVHLLLLF